MNDTIRIGIAEDHDLVRQGLVRMLNDYQEIKIILEAGNGKELLRLLTENKVKPKIILLDIAMPVINGIVAMEKIKERFPKLKIIVISAYTEEASILEYVKNGANAFLPKNCKIELLIEAIREVNTKGFYFEPSLHKLLIKKGLFPNNLKGSRPLTDRESLILKYFCEQKPYPEIADELGLNPNTVEWYQHKLLLKTNTENMKELIRFARSNKLVS